MVTHAPPSIRRLATTLTAALVLALHATALAQGTPATPAALDGLDARAAVELANAWKGNGLTSFVTTEAVHFAFPDGSEVSIVLPEHEVLVSVAPYFTHTHPCATHYMSGCQGELVGAPVHVLALGPDGAVLIDEVMTTPANGFLDLWLPRDLAIDLQMTLDGYRTVGRISTHAGSDTCVTTMRFSAAR